MISSHFVADKTNGPWKEEPDKVQWVDEATGLDCMIVRNRHMHHLCGYVGVPEGHPAYEKSYHDVSADVHGGLTYSSHCQENDKDHGICHVQEPGRPDRVWWLGFDCAHCDDLSPSRVPTHLPSILGGDDLAGNGYGTYRDIEYVREECVSLAAQLKAMDTVPDPSKSR